MCIASQCIASRVTNNIFSARLFCEAQKDTVDVIETRYLSLQLIDYRRSEYWVSVPSTSLFTGNKPNRDKKKCDEYYPKHYDDTTEDIPLLTETLKKYHTSSWTLTQWTLTLHRFPVPVLWIFIREDSKKMCRFSNFSVPLLLGSCNEQRLQYSAFTPGFGCCPVPVNEAPRGMIKITELGCRKWEIKEDFALLPRIQLTTVLRMWINSIRNTIQRTTGNVSSFLTTIIQLQECAIESSSKILIGDQKRRKFQFE
ncbi:hypothetical protein L3Y34_012865 [Caenorhabditis briggsae]|uniref:Uncharacterized protein n=1 Tax=Caenorhabditis briggsae TaxID=6238 RepID=A0AAE9CWY8_CAEBR|nr:hypothetical protein L3Y34_012865 [Caenorhabditis briggsae]